MDWFTWLSKAGFEPALVYEYGMAFAHNELEEDDVVYLNHEFLQSMGIAIAKHRLEILKLAKRERKAGDELATRPIADRLLLAVKRTRRRLAKCLRALVRSSECEERSALMVVRRPQAMVAVKKSSQKKLMITNGSFSSRRVNSFASPIVLNLKSEEDDHYDHHEHDHDHDQLGDDQDKYWSSRVEEIRWDTLFQDLKPT